MAVILSIETSTTVCSAALHEQGHLIAAQELLVPQSAASQLHVQIDSLFKKNGVSAKSLEAVALASGPGSYTGLRIGAATAKGICYSLDLPLIAIDSLKVLASGVNRQKDLLLCPMIDARRMEVYCALFDPQLNMIQPIVAKVIDETSFSDFLEKETILFFGDGAMKCQAFLKSQNAVFLDGIRSSATNMGTLAYGKFKAGLFENPAAFEPNYLKEFQAKTKTV